MTGLPLQSQTRPVPPATHRRVSWTAACDCGSGRDATWTQTQTDDERVTADDRRADCECEER